MLTSVFPCEKRKYMTCDNEPVCDRNLPINEYQDPNDCMTMQPLWGGCILMD